MYFLVQNTLKPVSEITNFEHYFSIDFNIMYWCIVHLISNCLNSVGYKKIQAVNLYQRLQWSVERVTQLMMMMVMAMMTNMAMPNRAIVLN